MPRRYRIAKGVLAYPVRQAPLTQPRQRAFGPHTLRTRHTLSRLTWPHHRSCTLTVHALQRCRAQPVRALTVPLTCLHSPCTPRPALGVTVHVGRTCRQCCPGCWAAVAAVVGVKAQTCCGLGAGGGRQSGEQLLGIARAMARPKWGSASVVFGLHSRSHARERRRMQEAGSGHVCA